MDNNSYQIGGKLEPIDIDPVLFNPKKVDKTLLKGFMDVYRRKQNNKKLPKEVIYKREKIKKVKRRATAKIRSINKAKHKLNKFQR